ncbi:hypothetical protein [Gorillibacterium sp. sgz5001074]|uniref:hypothetical protein n=1 Tax=Gorillibacterium sp. sgz5001074 TaxID=3446695 RepID=UPI003F67058C
MNSKHELVEQLAAAEPGSYAALREEYKQGGYSMFNELLEGLRDELMAADESGIGRVKELVGKGREIVPDPGAISPAWERVWEDYDRYIFHKSEALTAVTPENRDGEWQIVMDNPFTNEGIACYPALSFVEAAYLFAYFRKDLKKNEYIRLQKIANLLMVQGD